MLISDYCCQYTSAQVMQESHSLFHNFYQFGKLHVIELSNHKETAKDNTENLTGRRNEIPGSEERGNLLLPRQILKLEDSFLQHITI